jgi:hypothetical protein
MTQQVAEDSATDGANLGAFVSIVGGIPKLIVDVGGDIHNLDLEGEESLNFVRGFTNPSLRHRGDVVQGHPRVEGNLRAGGE